MGNRQHFSYGQMQKVNIFLENVGTNLKNNYFLKENCKNAIHLLK